MRCMGLYVDVETPSTAKPTSPKRFTPWTRLEKTMVADGVLQGLALGSGTLGPK